MSSILDGALGGTMRQWPLELGRRLGRLTGRDRTEERRLRALEQVRSALDPHSALMASCRQLRTILLSSPGPAAEKPFDTVLVTGLRGTLEELATVCGLAKALAEVAADGVLLVDADCRYPVLHDLFDVDLAPGLADLGDGARNLGGFVHSVSGHLALLTNGSDRERASRLLGTGRQSEWFLAARESYDFVVLNAPGLLVHPETTAVAGLAMNVVLLLQAEQDDETSAREARALLEQVGARVMGLALVGGQKD